MANGYPTEKRVKFARLLFEGMSVPQACAKMGIPVNTGKDWLTREDVKLYISEWEKDCKAAVAEELTITRQQVLAKYWAWANIPPELTKHNTSSQKAALDAVREMMGFNGPDPETQRDTQSFYRSEWIRDDQQVQ